MVGVPRISADGFPRMDFKRGQRLGVAKRATRWRFKWTAVCPSRPTHFRLSKESIQKSKLRHENHRHHLQTHGLPIHFEFRHENHRHHLQTHGLPIDFDFVTKSIETPCKRRILSICLIFRALFQCIYDRAAARSA